MSEGNLRRSPPEVLLFAVGNCPMPKKSKQATLSIEVAKFAAQVRGARAILNWSQTELGERTGFTQRSIHKLEQGSDIRRSTALAIVKAFRDAGTGFEELPSGPFKIVVSLQALESTGK